MNDTIQPAFRLVGLKLGHKTTNEGGQSGKDCGNLWQQFETEELAAQIPRKLGDEIYAVYFDYEGDHPTQPFSYFIGCKVTEDAAAPAGMDSLAIPAQQYRHVTAKGVIPDCIADAWKAIWNVPLERAYGYDFEVYDERSKDWSDGVVEIFVSSR